MSEKPNNSRQLANNLRQYADSLDNIDAFELDSIVMLDHYGALHLSFYDKNKFVTAVKAIGSATKLYGEGDYASLYVMAKNFPITLEIPRDKVCRKVVKFECDPLFTAEELETL